MTRHAYYDNRNNNTLIRLKEFLFGGYKAGDKCIVCDKEFKSNLVVRQGLEGRTNNVTFGINFNEIKPIHFWHTENKIKSGLARKAGIESRQVESCRTT